MSSKEIKRLSRNVYDSLRSSTFLFDLPRVVEELVHNSVDAGSTKVVVSLSVRSCYVKVDDNGCGVSRDGLVILGENNDAGTGTENLGFRGEALSSISNISLLEIRSKARGKPNAYCKIIKSLKCLFFGIDDQREDVGTTVIVRDLFYNQPIRRKSMQSSLRKVLHSVKKYVFRIALAHPHVSFKVIEIEGEQKLLCTIPSLSSLPLVTDGFGNEVSSSLREIVFSDGDLSLSGYISGPIGAFSTKVFQYIYINARFISKCPIHNLINSLAASFLSAAAKLRDASENHCRKRQKTQEYPAYLLNLCCPLSSYVLSFEPSKTVVEFKDLGNVLSFFEQAIIPYWEQFASNLFQGRAASRKVFFQESGSRREVFHEEVSNALDTFSGDASNYQLNRLCDDKADCVSFSKTCHSKNDLVEVSNSFCQHEGRTFQGKTYVQKVDDLYESPLACDSDGKVLTLMENERFNSPCCSTSYGFDEHHDFLKEPISQKEECTTDENLNNNFLYSSDNLFFRRNIRKSFLQERGNSQPPVIGVIRKCQKWPQQVKSSFEISPFFRDHACSEEASLSHRKVAEYVDDADSKLGLSHFGFMDSWIARTPPRLNHITSDSALIENHLNVQGANYKHYVIGEINAEFPDTVLSESREVSPDLNFTGSTAAALRHKSQSDFLLDQFRTPKGASSSKETGCLLFESSSVRDADIYNTSLHNFARQNSHEEAVESPTQNKEFQNSLFSHVHEFGLRRSYSAPPFYKGKKKFPILNCLPTDNARENSKMESSHCIDAPDCSSGFNCQLEPYSASQPCMMSITEPKQACLREINYEKSNRSNKVEMQTSEEFDNGSVADEIDPASVSLTKWRTCSLRPAFNHDSIMPHKIDVLDISSGLLHLAGSSLVPASINKGCLDNVRVLLQLDRKFIPVVASGILLVIDQHAADERIRLEELRKKVLHGELRNSTYLNPEHELVLPELGYQLLQKYAEQIKKWGWICNINSPCSESFAWSTNFLRQQKCRATLVAVPHILGTDLTGKDLLEYIEQLVETDGSSMIPPAVIRILNCKACRGAIMFGDALLPSECSLIVDELKATSLCFQCAHGRPTTVPLLNISALHEQLSRLDIPMAERCSDSWHGLRHHTPSIKRACQRLESCKRFLH